MVDVKKVCACGTGKRYDKCCGLYHVGLAAAPTALELMRSRYTAFVYDKFDYLFETVLPSAREPDLRDCYQETNRLVSWIGLEIISLSQGATTDKTGKVEFKASYIKDKQIHVHHEYSRFRKSAGKWYYVDGIINGTA